MKLKDACSLEESYDQLRQCIIKQRHYFANKGQYSQSYGFSSSHVQMWGLNHKEGWVLKNWPTFKLWCWTRLLRVPWTARKSNQSILKEINPEYSLEGLMLKLKPQCFGHLMWRTDSLERTLMLGKTEARRRRGRQRMGGWMISLTWWTWVWSNSWSWWWTGKPGMLHSMGSHRVRHDWATELTECFQCPSIFLQWWDFLLYIADNIQVYKYLKVLVAQLCLILCHPMGYSLPGSSVYEIL